MTSRSNGARKVSRAAMARQLAQVHAERGQSRQLPPNLAKLINEYESRLLDQAQIERVRPFVYEVVAASSVRSEDSVRDYRTHLAALAEYAVQRGKPLTSTDLLTTEFIDEYIAVGLAGEADPFRARRRSLLLGLARTINPGPTAPAKLTPIPHSAVRPPYTPTELAVIKRVSRTQPTEAKRRDLCAVVSLGAGAGLDSVDLRALYCEHIEDLGPAGMQIHVQTPRPRLVPLRVSFAELLRSAMVDRRPQDLVLGDKIDRRNIAARAVENAALYQVPHIEQARLRATWLADLMTDCVPLGVLLHAAGLKSARTFIDLLPHLDPWLTHKGLPTADTLRGGAR